MWISEEDILWPKNCLHNNYTMERGQMFKYIGIYLLFAWLELKLRDQISIIFSHKLILICIITVSGFILQQRDIFFKIHNIVKKWKSVYEHHYTCIPSKTAFFSSFFLVDICSYLYSFWVHLNLNEDIADVICQTSWFLYNCLHVRMLRNWLLNNMQDFCTRG